MASSNSTPLRIDWARFDECRAEGLIDDLCSLDLDSGEFGMPEEDSPGRWVRVFAGVRATDPRDPFYGRERFERLQSWFRVFDGCREVDRGALRAALLRWDASPGTERKEAMRAFKALVDPETHARHEAEEQMRWRSDFLHWLSGLPAPVDALPPWAAEVDAWRAGRAEWAIDPELVAEAERFVRGGFLRPHRIRALLMEETHDPGEIEPWAAAAAVGTAIATVREEQRGWPAETDCDRLDRVFADLQAQGIITLQNAGYTQSDGYDDVREVHARGPEGHVGYCFFHGQDLERAVAGAGLHLAFGPIDPREEQARGPEIGRQIVATLGRRGLETKWDGTFEKRIHVTPFDWKKRGPLDD